MMVNQGWRIVPGPKRKAHYYLFTRRATSLCGDWETPILDHLLPDNVLAPEGAPRCQLCQERLHNRQKRGDS